MQTILANHQVAHIKKKLPGSACPPSDPCLCLCISSLGCMLWPGSSATTQDNGYTFAELMRQFTSMQIPARGVPCTRYYAHSSFVSV